MHLVEKLLVVAMIQSITITIAIAIKNGSQQERCHQKGRCVLLSHPQC